MFSIFLQNYDLIEANQSKLEETTFTYNYSQDWSFMGGRLKFFINLFSCRQLLQTKR